MKKIKQTEEELVLHLKSSDAKRFEIVYDYFSSALYGIINKILDNEEQAQGLLQETFLKVWNNSASYNQHKSRLFTWMLNIARNTAIDYIRSAQGKNEKKNQSADIYVNTLEGNTNSRELHNHIGLRKIINELKEEHRQIIDLVYFEGYTQDEISKKLNMPLGTVKTRSRTAIQTLRKALSSEID